MAEFYIQDTFADIEDEFCNEFSGAEELIVHNVDDDEFAWPESERTEFYNMVDEEASDTQQQKSIHCEECDYKTSRRSNLTRHIRTAHSMLRFHCEVCEKSFSDNCSLSRHVATAHTKSSYSCSFCGFSATRPSNLKVHIEAVHSPATHRCDLCDYVGGTNQSLRRHKANRHSDRPTCCPVEGLSLIHI